MERAKATQPADEAKVKDVIQKGGGYAEVNEAVSRELRRWAAQAFSTIAGDPTGDKAGDPRPTIKFFTANNILLLRDPSLRHITLSDARSRLDRRRFLRSNSHFAAFFKIYKIYTLMHRSELNINYFLEKFV